MWEVTGYAAARAALGDPHLGHAVHAVARASAAPPPVPTGWLSRLLRWLRPEGRQGVETARGEPGKPDPVVGTQARWLVSLNPPDHTRLRRALMDGLSSARVQGLRPAIEARARHLLDVAQHSGAAEVDLVGAYGAPLTMGVITDLLGLPDADLPLCHRALEHWQALLDGSVRHDSPQGQLHRASVEEFVALLRGVVVGRRQDPGSDLISALLAWDDAHPLDDDEVVATAALMGIAGQVTTKDLLGTAFFELARRGTELRALRRDDGSLDAAVRELLRYAAPVRFVYRHALADTEVAGTPLRAGELVCVRLDAANRDTAIWPDAEALVLQRKQNPHVAFGHGIHACAGSGLARLEAAVALEVLGERTPRLTLSRPEGAVAWQAGAFNGPVAVWVQGWHA